MGLSRRIGRGPGPLGRPVPLYGAIAEQMRRLDDLGIDDDVTPGVPAIAAAAAALKTELTLPHISQTVVLTRTAADHTHVLRPKIAGAE